MNEGQNLQERQNGSAQKPGPQSMCPQQPHRSAKQEGKEQNRDSAKNQRKKVSRQQDRRRVKVSGESLTEPLQKRHHKAANHPGREVISQGPPASHMRRSIFG